MAQATGLRLPHASSSKRTDRMLAVLKTVNSRGAVPLADLATELRVSAATLRRDLADMEDQGLLIRTHGGARPNAAHDEMPVHLRDQEAKEAKHRIAIRAAELIPSGPYAVALSGGTTTAGIARALARRTQLTIVTNAVPIAMELAARPNAKVILTGGMVRSTSFEAVGVLAEATFKAVNVGTAILGVDGISAAGGATTHDEVEARTNHAMVDHAQRVMVVTDGSKVGRVTLARMADPEQIDLLITDSTADPTELDALRAVGVTVHVVEPRR
ncbi:DeoR/GlpR family DNA-binding transcription regulator [uncultured Amnibacterium sp.]|uniref:DeoR/GlpR family DNA-binding transcription regulator n=1 Tax=uncultured Amnibacterium sp. TaxID=1631851 RepID=UPI0035C98AD9